MDAEKLIGKDSAQREKLDKEFTGRGGVLSILYFDLHAASGEVIKQLGTALVQKLIQEEGVVYAIGEIDEPIRNDNLLSSAVEVRLLVRNFSPLARICGNYSPFSVEVLKPDEIKLSIGRAHELLSQISVNNYELKKLILEKVYTKDDLEKFRKSVGARLNMAKKALEEKK